jgi:two-component system, NtrC family, sensor histidine kinase PilS
MVDSSRLAKPPFMLAGRAAWQGLADLAAQSLRDTKSLHREVTVLADGVQRQLQVKTYLSILPDTPAQGSLCVMFMEDLREVEARVRTEKLAAMGRMSAAVAHEIRNPLSAISQANELLAEEIQSPQQKNLVRMVAQNVQRLNRVVEDVLDVARVQSGAKQSASLHDPGRLIRSVCTDWMTQNKVTSLHFSLVADTTTAIEFEADHLRRVLVNLLDNALRYASTRAGAIQVTFQATGGHGLHQLSVWSDGAPIDPGVQRHLFEPFFSSQSRSSGLGLYICRELCARHDATIAYQRSSRVQLSNEGFPLMDSSYKQGNDFMVLVRPSSQGKQLMSVGSPALKVPRI